MPLPQLRDKSVGRGAASAVKQVMWTELPWLSPNDPVTRISLVDTNQHSGTSTVRLAWPGHWDVARGIRCDLYQQCRPHLSTQQGARVQATLPLRIPDHEWWPFQASPWERTRLVSHATYTPSWPCRKTSHNNRPSAPPPPSTPYTPNGRRQAGPGTRPSGGAWDVSFSDTEYSSDS